MNFIVQYNPVNKGLLIKIYVANWQQKWRILNNKFKISTYLNQLVIASQNMVRRAIFISKSIPTSGIPTLAILRVFGNFLWAFILYLAIFWTYFGKVSLSKLVKYWTIHQITLLPLLSGWESTSWIVLVQVQNRFGSARRCITNTI